MTNRWWPRRAQGAYYIATGLWPVIGVRNYMDATGQENHARVAQVLGGAVAALGLALVADAFPPRATRWIGLGAAVALGAGGAFFGAQGKGQPVNFTDAAVQAAFALTWAFCQR